MFDRLVFRADDADTGAKLVADPQFFAVSSQHKAAWPFARADVFDNFLGAEVNVMNHISLLGRHVGVLAIGHDQDAFRLAADLDLKQLFARFQAVGAQNAVVFDGDEHGLAIGTQVKHLRALIEWKLLGHLACFHIDEPQRVAVAAAHINLGVVGSKAHVAWALAHVNG